MELPDIFAAEKELTAEAQWIERDPRFHRGRLSLSAALEIEGITVSGLRLSGTALINLPDEAVTFQLVYTGSRQHKGGPICRVEWRALNSHNNKGRGPAEFQNLLITGSHHHRFDLCWKYAAADVRRGNPAIAVPMTAKPTGAEELDPHSYRDLLAFVGKEFRINNMCDFVPDPWGDDLFRTAR